MEKRKFNLLLICCISIVIYLTVSMWIILQDTKKQHQYLKKQLEELYMINADALWDNPKPMTDSLETAVREWRILLERSTYYYMLYNKAQSEGKKELIRENAASSFTPQEITRLDDDEIRSFIYECEVLYGDNMK